MDEFQTSQDPRKFNQDEINNLNKTITRTSTWKSTLKHVLDRNSQGSVIFKTRNTLWTERDDPGIATVGRRKEGMEMQQTGGRRGQDSSDRWPPLDWGRKNAVKYVIQFPGKEFQNCCCIISSFYSQPLGIKGLTERTLHHSGYMQHGWCRHREGAWDLGENRRHLSHRDQS